MTVAHIKYIGRYHLLIEHTPGEGTHPRAERCPDRVTFERFEVAAAGLRKAGMSVPSIREMFPEAYGNEHPSIDDRSTSNVEKGYSIDEFIGFPPGEPGPIFELTAAMENRPVCSESRQRSYRTTLDRYGQHLVGRPMSTITRQDAQRYVDNLYACPSCIERAEAAGRGDLTINPGRHLHAARDPWDGLCEDDTGESTHATGLRRTTIQNAIGQLRFAWKVAIWAGEGEDPHDPRCASVTGNPFEHIVKHRAPQPKSRMTGAFAFTYTDIAQISKHMPAEFAAVVPVTAFGMLRRGESAALNRGNVILPSDLDGHSVIHITHTIDDSGNRVGDGKTMLSTDAPIVLPASLTPMLHEHLDRFHGPLDPLGCEACRNGEEPKHASREANPHHGCGLADDAPLWADPRTGRRLTPDTLGRIFGKAVSDAGLDRGNFKPTFHTLRSTGATLRLEAGESLESVVKQGRWANSKVLEKHYLRPTLPGQQQINDRLDANIAASTTGEIDDDASLQHRIDQMRHRISYLEAENQRLLHLLNRKPANRSTCTHRRFRTKGPHSERELRRALEPPRTWADLAHRLGLTGSANTLRSLKRQVRDLGIAFPPED